MTWTQIAAAPGFDRQCRAVLDFLVAKHADTADDRDAYLAFAATAHAQTMVPHLTVTPNGDGTVSVSGVAINDHVLTEASFVAGHEIVAVDIVDLTEASST